MESEIKAVKDKGNELAVPTSWRPVFRSIVGAFIAHDYSLSSGVSGVGAISIETAEQIKEYIRDYGEELVELSDETWKSSICIWMDNHWDVMIDLWTASEGRSDLVLSVEVLENDDGLIFEIYMIYVP